MAINIWTPSTADRSILAGGMALAQGVRGGLQNLSEGITRGIEAKKQRGQLATSLRKTLSVAYPDRKDEFAAMSLPDLQGTLEGEAVKSANAKAQLADSLQREQLENLKAQRASRAALPDLYRSLAQSGLAPEEVPAPLSNVEFDRRTRPLDTRTLFESLARSGAPVDVRDAADLASALERGQKTGFDPSLVIDLPGAPGYKKTQTSSGQYQVLPPRQLPDEKEPIIHLGIGEPNLLGDYPNKLAVTPSQLRKHRKAIEELGFKIPDGAPGKTAGATVPAPINAPARPSSKAEYDALPPGSYYIDPATNTTKRKKSTT